MKVINVKSHFLFSHLFHSLQQSLTIKYIERHSCYICYDGLQLLPIITKLCNIIYSNCGHDLSLCAFPNTHSISSINRFVFGIYCMNVTTMILHIVNMYIYI